MDLLHLTFQQWFASKHTREKCAAVAATLLKGNADLLEAADVSQTALLRMQRFMTKDADKYDHALRELDSEGRFKLFQRLYVHTVKWVILDLVRAAFRRPITVSIDPGDWRDVVEPPDEFSNMVRSVLAWAEGLPELQRIVLDSILLEFPEAPTKKELVQAVRRAGGKASERQISSALSELREAIRKAGFSIK